MPGRIFLNKKANEKIARGFAKFFCAVLPSFSARFCQVFSRGFAKFTLFYYVCGII